MWKSIGVQGKGTEEKPKSYSSLHPQGSLLDWDLILHLKWWSGKKEEWSELRHVQP